MSNLGNVSNCPNDEPNFDPRIERELGCYVYVLKDRGSIFYVGKGGGTGAGNYRAIPQIFREKSSVSMKYGREAKRLNGRSLGMACTTVSQLLK